MQLSDQNDEEASDESEVKKPEFLQHKKADLKRQNLHHNHKPSDEMDLLIETINTSDLGWTADVCKLQKHHHMYDADRCEEPISLGQTEVIMHYDQDYSAWFEDAERAGQGEETESTSALDELMKEEKTQKAAASIKKSFEVSAPEKAAPTDDNKSFMQKEEEEASYGESKDVGQGEDWDSVLEKA